MSEVVPACHGVAVDPEDVGLELGWLTKPPPHAVRVELLDSVERASDAELVWQLEEPPGFGLPAITVESWSESPDSFWMGNTLNLSLRVDFRRSIVSVAAANGKLQVVLEALASVALPLVAQRGGSLVLHASAACIDDSAVMLCADSGSGKSSLLLGLVAAGWQALSEDQCIVDLDSSGHHRVWPGPSWARLKRGAALPPLVVDQPSRFETVDKVAWDLGERIAHSPVNLDRIVLLEPPGGREVVWEPLAEGEVISSLITHATWLQRQDAFAPAVLPQVVKLGLSVPGFRMRLPREPDWLERGLALLSGR